MAEDKPNRSLLVLAFGIFVAGVVLVTAMVTLDWSDGADPAQSRDMTAEEQDEEDEGAASEADDSELVEAQADPNEDELQIYDLPDHSGRLVAERDGDRFGLPRITASYDVDVRGDLATVVVEQSFKNPTQHKLHPVYQFPLYSESAVYAMEMTVGDRTITADVKRKEEAREEYEKAKRQGKKAALLAQNRPNLFTQRVANLEPGQQVDITIRYTHTVPKAEGYYRLLVPLAIGDRFNPPDMSDNALVDGEMPQQGQNPSATLSADEVDLEVRLDGGMPISNVRSATHNIRMQRLSETDRRVELAEGDIPADTHFRARYQLAGDDMRTGSNAYWDADDAAGYFNLRVEPPLSPAPDETLRREMVFAIDKSGSMNGAPMRDTKRFVRKSLEHLRPSDTFRIVIFSNNASDFADEPLKATPENIERAQAFIDRLSASGGTMMERGIRQVLEPQVPEGSIRLVTFLTDGQIGNEFGIIKLLREKVGDARMFAVGVGNHPNTFLLEEMGRAGRGFTRIMDPNASNDHLIDEAVDKLQTPVLTDLSIDWGELDVQGVTPEDPPDVFAEDTVRVHAMYGTPGTYDIVIRGQGAGGETLEFPMTLELPETSSDGESVKLAWARQRIADYMHELETPDELRRVEMDSEALKERIVQLGLEHDLSTQWTSFVAVDDEGPVATNQPADSEAKPEPVVMNKRRLRAPAPKLEGGGGLGLSGTGRGGGGMADKSAGIGAFGSGTGTGYGKGAGEQAQRTSKIPQVVPGKPTVRGSLDKEIVRRVIRMHRREIKFCYEQQLLKDAKLAGKVEVRFVIGPNGDVTAATVQSSTMKNAKVESCMTKKIRRWVFPKPKGGGVVIVNYPFVFKSS
jgi:Ca-activated chloride channel family protein